MPFKYVAAAFNPSGGLSAHALRTTGPKRLAWIFPASTTQIQNIRIFEGLMMIKCHLSRILGERRLKISDVARDTQLNRGTITRLYHETSERIELDALNALCKYLSCDLSDLLEYVPDEPGKEG